MKAPIITKKDKRSHEEVRMDELISALSDQAQTPEEADKVLKLMKAREELKNCKKSKVDPNVVISGIVGLVQIGAILKVEDMKVITSKAMNFVHKGRLR